MSLLVNAVMDYGFINYVMNNNVQSTWIWDLFFIADFLIMAAALYWYNRHHISREHIVKMIRCLRYLTLFFSRWDECFVCIREDVRLTK
jgi:hypothetical protein